MAVQTRAPCWLPQTHLAGCWPQPQPRRLIHSFVVLLNFHTAGSFQLCCQAGTGCRQVSPPFLQPHASPASREGQAAPHHLLCPVAHCYIWDTNKLLVLLFFVPGLNLLRLPPAQEFTASPTLDCTHELLTPHCCSSCSSVSPGATMPCSHLRGSRQLPATPSCSCPDAARDLSQVPPLGWKNPRPGSCKASSNPHIGDQMGTSFPWLQQERGAKGLCCQPWALSILVPTGMKGGGWPHTASRCSL